MIVNDQNLETCNILIFSNIFMKTKGYNGALQINRSIKTKDYSIPAVIYLLKVNNRNTRRRCEIVNNKDTRTKPMALFLRLYCLLWTYFRFCSSVSIVSFEHVISGWEYGKLMTHILCDTEKVSLKRLCILTNKKNTCTKFLQYEKNIFIRTVTLNSWFKLSQTEKQG